MRRHISFDCLETRRLCDGDPNYDTTIGWLNDTGTIPDTQLEKPVLDPSVLDRLVPTAPFDTPPNSTGETVYPFSPRIIDNGPPQ